MRRKIVKIGFCGINRTDKFYYLSSRLWALEIKKRYNVKVVYFILFLTEFILLFILSRVLVKNISQLFARLSGNKNLAMRLFHFFLLPGVIVHELAHLISAEVMLVRTGNLSFSLEPQDERLVMGSVGITQTDPIRRAIIGFSPVIIGILVISFSVFYFLSNRSPINSPWNYALVFFIVFEVGNTMFSSKKDLEGTIQLFFVTALVVFASYFVGIRISESIFSYFNSESFTQIVKRGIWVLLFPIAIDGVLIIFARLLKKQ
ncbi:MAG: hypothetical protein HY426_01550 [Candidatus Levybacteria bacterium]|nr:hypothetical protein [Candidatus Levybacteria bacterium]